MTFFRPARTALSHVEAGTRHTRVVATLAGAAAICLSGCGDSGPDTLRLDPGPVRTPRIELLVPGQVQFAAPLPGWVALACSPDGLFRIDPSASTPVELGALGSVVSAAAVGEHGVLLSTAEGFWGLDDESLAPSPLDDVLEAPGAQLLSIPGAEPPELWIAAPGVLAHVHDGELDELSAAELELDSPLLAYGAVLDGRAVPWLGTSAGVWALVAGADGRAEAVPAGPRVAVSALAADGVGNLWIVSDHTLWRRLPDGAWAHVELGDPVDRVVADRAQPEVWVQGGSSTWLIADGQLGLVDGVTGTLTAVDAAGRALLLSPGGLERLTFGRPVLFDGLEDGAALAALTEVRILPTDPEAVTDVRARVDDAAIEVLADPVRVDLDPLSLEDGAHVLTVEVSYGEDGGEPVQDELYFHVGQFVAPRWAHDVEPLFLDRCAKCHGPNGGAHRLDGLSFWQAQIDRILEVVTEGRMPLTPNPPLEPGQIEMIRAWRAAGFPE